MRKTTLLILLTILFFGCADNLETDKKVTHVEYMELVESDSVKVLETETRVIVLYNSGEIKSVQKKSLWLIVYIAIVNFMLGIASTMVFIKIKT